MITLYSPNCKNLSLLNKKEYIALHKVSPSNVLLFNKTNSINLPSLLCLSLIKFNWFDLEVDSLLSI
jgi:hypothetical protein